MDAMTDSRKPGQAWPASLWTMTVPVGMAPLGEAKVDLSISKEQIQQALTRVQKRAQAFSGKVDVAVWWTTVGIAREGRAAALHETKARV